MSKRIVYIAAPWVNKAEARAAKEQLEAAGHTTTSRWIDYHPDVEEGHPDYEKMLTEQAIQDLDDLDRADTFVILNLGKSEGKATELGYALAMRTVAVDVGFGAMPEIYLIGEKTINIFYHLPEVCQVGSVEELIERWEVRDE